MLKAVTNSLLSIAFPQHCHNCSGTVEDRADGVACAACWSATRVLSDNHPSCSRCGNVAAPARVSENVSCRECEGHSYDTAVAGGIYENALSAVLLELKRTPHIPGRAEELLYSAFERIADPAPDRLVPVPLAPHRRAERGFNQAEVIGDLLSKWSGIPLDSFSLVRSKHTPMHRAAMDRRARDFTVKNAFEVTRPQLIAGRSIVLVDDIFTTGATASYCAKELKNHGATEVRVITLARAQRANG